MRFNNQVPIAIPKTITVNLSAGNPIANHIAIQFRFPILVFGVFGIVINESAA